MKPASPDKIPVVENTRVQLHQTVAANIQELTNIFIDFKFSRNILIS